MAGSIAQVAVPLAIGTYFAARRRDLVGAALCLAWAGTSANAVSIYIADAPTEALPLAGGGLHDWAFLLGPEGFDAMRSAGTIASAVRGMGLVMVLIAVASCLAGPLLAAHLHAPGSVGASSADPASQGRPLTEPAQAREVEAPVAPAVAEEARAAAPARELEAVPAPEGPPRAA
jgi:hypothetical protein